MSETPDSQILTITKIIHHLAKPGLTCQVVYVMKEKGEEEIESSLSYMQLDRNTIPEIANTCMYFVKNRQDWKFEEYGKNKDDEIARKYRTKDVKEIPKTRKILEDPTNFEQEVSEKLIKNVKFIQFRFFTPDGKKAIFFKKFTGSKFLLKEKLRYHVIRAGILSFSDQNMVDLPREFDCVLYGGHMLIFHEANFEELFDYQEIHEKDHKEVFKTLEKADYSIIELEKYKDQCFHDAQKLRKFAAIKEKELYKMNLSEIKHLVKVRPVNSLHIDPSTKELEFDNVHAFLDFFNDNHLTSPFTKTNYLSQSKSIEST